MLLQASTSAVQRAGVNRSFTGMGSRGSSAGKLPMLRTASGSVLDQRQEQDAGASNSFHKPRAYCIVRSLLIQHLCPSETNSQGGTFHSLTEDNPGIIDPGRRPVSAKSPKCMNYYGSPLQGARRAKESLPGSGESSQD